MSSPVLGVGEIQRTRQSPWPQGACSWGDRVGGEPPKGLALHVTGDPIEDIRGGGSNLLLSCLKCGLSALWGQEQGCPLNACRPGCPGCRVDTLCVYEWRDGCTRS